MDQLSKTLLAAVLTDADRLRDSMNGYSDDRRMELEEYARERLGAPRLAPFPPLRRLVKSPISQPK